MTRTTVLVFLSLCAALAACTDSDGNRIKVADHVNVFIGTSGSGHAFPGATVPFGMVQLSPDTGAESWSYCSGYQFADTTLYGFSHTHLSGTGGGDLGDILFLPLVGPSDNSWLTEKKKAGMDKATEAGSPGYYTVTLDNGVKSELTTSVHTGLHRYSYPAGVNRMLLIDLVHAIKRENILKLEFRQVSPTEVAGMRYGDGWAGSSPVYFVARFSQPIAKITALGGGKITDATELSGNDLKVLLEFGEGEIPVEIAVGISATGYEGAYKNIGKESSKIDFDRTRKLAVDAWNDELGKVQIVEGSDDNEKTIFYTALYHALIAPNVFSDVDGRYLGMDGTVHEGNGEHYTLFSLWDTFRAVHPLFSIIDRGRAEDMMNSLIAKAEQNGGRYPKWELWAGDTDVMIGNHALSVLGEACVKGFKDIDWERAYRLAKSTFAKGRDQFPLYEKYGYVPCNEVGWKSVSKTVEYAYNDYCLAQIAKKLGYTEDYEFYAERSKNYRNLFDGETGFFRGRENAGRFMPGFQGSYMDRNFTEATPWQYRHFAPHDIMGLLNLLGGRDSLAKSLDDLFNADSEILGNKLPDVTGQIGQYAHGNEPSHGTAFLYAYSSEPWKTSAYTREIVNRFYLNEPKGLCGNDDCGQMSAWYVFAALGFYPMNPCSDEFILTAPLFGETKVRLSGGNSLTIKTTGDRRDPYINKITLNGRELDRNYIKYDEIMDGGTLVFDLSPTPNTTRAISDDVMPGSLTTRFHAPTPYIIEDYQFFDPDFEAVLHVRNPQARIYYTLDGTTPDNTSALYDGPFRITGNTVIKAVAYVDGMEPGDVMTANAFKADYLPGVNASLAGAKPGLHYDLYRGRMQSTEDMAGKKPVESGFTEVWDPKQIGGEGNFYGVIYKAYLKIDTKAVYEFFVNSDDGAVLLIDGHEVVRNDGSHAPSRATGRVALDKGVHELEMRYFQDTGGQTLHFGFKGGGMSTPWMLGPMSQYDLVFARQ